MRPTGAGVCMHRLDHRSQTSFNIAQEYLAYFNKNDTVGNVPFWACDLRPGQSIARLDVEVPGVTNKYVLYFLLLAYPLCTHAFTTPHPGRYSIDGTPDTCCGNANTTRDLLGWVNQLAFRQDIRRLVMTRNTGTVGYVGLRRGATGSERNSGWQMIFDKGAPRQLNLYMQQVMPNTPLYVALRYPVGTTFMINRQYRWEPCLNRRVFRAANVSQFSASPDGMRFHVSTCEGDGVFLACAGRQFLSMRHQHTQDQQYAVGVSQADGPWECLQQHRPDC